MAPTKKKKTPPDDHSIHSYSSENNLPPPDPDVGKIHWKRELSVDHNINVDLVALVQTLRRKNLPHVAQEILHEINSGSLPLDNSALSALMLCYADNGLFHEAQAIWDEVLNSSFRPNIHIISKLIEAYGRMGRFDDVTRILHQASLRDSNLLPEIYVVALSCFGKQGQLELMENTLREMGSRGFSVDSAIGNAYIIYYSLFGSLTEIEAAYGRLKRSRILIEKDGIRAMSFAYIKEKKFYRLGEFLRDVGLGRRNVGNLLWNLLLLSYAANFKMKTLQREFLRMVEAGFHPDLTTFNIRALAFSKMSLFWDLHLSLEHMKHEQVVPDLVTYGCIVDAYLDKRLGMNLDFALSKMNVHASPQVFTDPFVFEVLGKGGFHSSSEAFLKFKRKNWTYKELISTYLKKKLLDQQAIYGPAAITEFYAYTTKHMEGGPNGQKICNGNVEWNTIWLASWAMVGDMFKSGSMKMKADMDESSPNATMLATQDVAYQCNVLGLSPLNFYMLNYIMFQAPGYMREQN
ncbi:unnamed protein product [Camellia sinensis]